MEWITQTADETNVATLTQSLNITPTVASLLIKMGIDDPIKAQRFLFPRLSHLEDPFKLTNMDVAVERLMRAIDKKEAVTILGDYDVDGVTSTTLLTHALQLFGLEPKYIIPLRQEEGYGLTSAVIKRALKESSPDLFVALDCGTNSAKEVASLNKKGVDTIVVDHHQIKEGCKTPEILVNPHVHGDGEASVSLCTAGLVFKLVHALFKRRKEQDCEVAEGYDIKDLLDLVALGTISDLVPLTQENRILTHFGLKKIQHSNRPGIQALCRAAGINPGQEVKTGDVAFRLGPRINASGRLEDAALPVSMLLAKDFQSSSSSATKLNEMNTQRQSIERTITLEAQEVILKENLQTENAIVTYSPTWHPGVVGIVASKISREHHRPAFVLAQEGKLAKGSGRSIPGVNLVQALEPASHLLDSWGGHPMAAGVTLNPKNIDEFQAILNDSINKQLSEKTFSPTIHIAHELEASELNEALLNELEQLQPFGMGNSEPIFAIRNVQLKQPAQIFSKTHVRFQVPKPSGTTVAGIAWNFADNPPAHLGPIDIAAKFAFNFWNGRKYPQLELVDWKHSEA